MFSSLVINHKFMVKVNLLNHQKEIIEFVTDKGLV